MGAPPPFHSELSDSQPIMSVITSDRYNIRKWARSARVSLDLFLMMKIFFVALGGGLSKAFGRCVIAVVQTSRLLFKFSFLMFSAIETSERIDDGSASISFSLLYLIHTFYYVKMVLCYCFSAKVLNLTRMIGILWQESLSS